MSDKNQSEPESSLQKNSPLTTFGDKTHLQTSSPLTNPTVSNTSSNMDKNSNNTNNANTSDSFNASNTSYSSTRATHVGSYSMKFDNKENIERRLQTSEIEFAITLDNVPRLQRALEKEGGKKKSSYESIFEMAVKRSKVQICKFCLKQDPSINVNKEFASFPKSSALMQSIKTKTTTDKELYKLLLEHGADPRKGDEYFSPIQKAITNQDEDLIDALVESGVDLEEEDPNQKAQRGTPIWFALHMNCFQSFSHLIKLGANVNARRKGRSLLHYVSEHREIKQGVQIVKMLLDNHADIEAKDTRGMTPFLHAVDYGRVDIMKVLKDCGANIRALDTSDRNALTICVDSAHAIHHLETVEFVLGLDLEDSEAMKSLQNMVNKIGSPLYINLAKVFIRFGKDIKLPESASSTSNEPVNRIENSETKHEDMEDEDDGEDVDDENKEVHADEGDNEEVGEDFDE